MFKMLGRDNFYLWMVPTTWTRGENPEYTEDLCLESLEMCREILLESKKSLFACQLIKRDFLSAKWNNGLRDRAR